MSAGILLKYFNRISEAPDAIPRFRRFILDLAVRGKLVEQNPNDEPATELFVRIKVEKENARLLQRVKTTKEGKPQDIDNLVAFTPSHDMPFPIPSNWQWSDLGSISIKTGSGSTPRGGKSVYKASGVQFLRSQNIYNEGLRLDNVAYIDDPTHEKMSGTAVEPGDLLLNITGGSIGRCCCVPLSATIKANISQHVAIIRLAIQELCDFVHWVVISPFFQSFIMNEQTGAGREGLPKNRMDRIPIALPPLAEQHRIVAKVDELMALCDQLQAAKNERETKRDRLVASSLNRIITTKADEAKDATLFDLDQLPRLTTRPEHIKQLRQTILNLAVRGRLVPQDPNDEPAVELLKRIQHEQLNLIKSGALKDRTALIGQENTELLFLIPAEWRWVKLAETIIFGPQNGISPKEIKDEKAPKAITLTATTSGNFNSKYFKNIELNEENCGSYWLSDGDVLFQRGNTREYVGMAAIYEGPFKAFIFPDLMIRVRFSNLLNLRFTHMVLVSPPLRRYFSSNATGASATMPKINQAVLLNTPIPLPPLAEQNRIVAKVDELMALCDELETQLTTTETDDRRLLEAVLSKALDTRQIESA